MNSLLKYYSVWGDNNLRRGHNQHVGEVVERINVGSIHYKHALPYPCH